MKQIFDRIPNDNMQLIDLHLPAILFSLFGDRKQILPDASSELLITYKTSLVD